MYRIAAQIDGYTVTVEVYEPADFTLVGATFPQVQDTDSLVCETCDTIVYALHPETLHPFVSDDDSGVIQCAPCFLKGCYYSDLIIASPNNECFRDASGRHATAAA